MSVSHFDEIAAVYDESLPAARRRALPAQARRVRARPAPGRVGARRRLRHRRARAAADRTRIRGHGRRPVRGDARACCGRAARRSGRSPASGTELPFSADSFDVVLSVATFHHIAAPDAVRATLAEMTRVARPGGRILIWDHNPRNPYWARLMARVPQDTGEERLIGGGRARRRADRRRRAGAEHRSARARARLHAARSAPRWRARSSGWSSGRPRSRSTRRTTWSSRRSGRLACCRVDGGRQRDNAPFDRPGPATARLGQGAAADRRGLRGVHRRLAVRGARDRGRGRTLRRLAARRPPGLRERARSLSARVPRLLGQPAPGLPPKPAREPVRRPRVLCPRREGDAAGQRSGHRCPRTRSCWRG